MKHFKLTMIAATVAVALGPALGPALAQDAGGPIDPGVWVVDVVHPRAPFRSPNIDPATIDIANIGATLEPLNDAQLLEVRQRCSTIVTNPSRNGAVFPEPYTEATVAFCNAVFAWVAANRPNAPDSDAELAAMQAAAP